MNLVKEEYIRFNLNLQVSFLPSLNVLLHQSNLFRAELDDSPRVASTMDKRPMIVGYSIAHKPFTVLTKEVQTAHDATVSITFPHRTFHLIHSTRSNLENLVLES